MAGIADLTGDPEFQAQWKSLAPPQRQKIRHDYLMQAAQDPNWRLLSPDAKRGILTDINTRLADPATDYSAVTAPLSRINAPLWESVGQLGGLSRGTKQAIDERSLTPLLGGALETAHGAMGVLSYPFTLAGGAVGEGARALGASPDVARNLDIGTQIGLGAVSGYKGATTKLPPRMSKVERMTPPTAPPKQLALPPVGGTSATRVGPPPTYEAGPMAQSYGTAETVHELGRAPVREFVPGAGGDASLKERLHSQADAERQARSVAAQAARSGQPVPAMLVEDAPDIPAVGWKRPPHEAFRQKVYRIWQDLTPRELALARETPDSPLMSLTKRLFANDADMYERLAAEGLHRRVDPDILVQSEFRARQVLRAGGTRAQAEAAMDPEALAIVRQLEQEFSQVQADKATLFKAPTHEAPFPYLPRRVAADADRVVNIHARDRGYARRLTESLGSFERPRTHDTMWEGQVATGPDRVNYENPNASIWNRRALNGSLHHTAEYVRGLQQGGVLFDNEAAAKAASPASHAYRVTGLPGDRDWWAANRNHAVYLRHQFQDPGSSFGRLLTISNVMFRNWQLINSTPHVVKNMLVKLIAGGGNPVTVWADVAELRSNPTSPLVQRFRAVDAFPESVRLPHEVSYEENLRLRATELGASPAQTLPARASLVARQIARAPNWLGSRVVFRWGDPGMKYHLWKQYIARGLSDTAAAQQAEINLVNYGQRSDVLDYWKRIPLNYFNTWKWGSLLSSVNLARGPAGLATKAAFTYAILGYTKEAVYRHTGWWFHTPDDWWGGPLSEFIDTYGEHRGYGHESIPSALGKGAIFGANYAFWSAALGVGGQYTAGQLSDFFKAANTLPAGDVAKLKRLWWGWGQLSGAKQEYDAFERTGDVSHLAKLAAVAALAAHPAKGKYRPRNMWMWMPESAPGMTYTDEMRHVENRRNVLLQEKYTKARVPPPVRPPETPEERQKRVLMGQ